MRQNTKTEIRVRGSEEAPFKLLATYADDEDATIHAFGADGNFLYVTGARDSNTERLVKLDAESGKETVVDQDPDYDVDGPIISEHTHMLEGVAYYKDRLTYKAFDPQFQRDLDILQKVHDGEILFDNSTADEEKWIIYLQFPHRSRARLTFMTGRRERRPFLFRARPWLDPKTLVEHEADRIYEPRRIEACMAILAFPKACRR